MKFLNIINSYNSTLMTEQDAAPAAEIPQVSEPASTPETIPQPLDIPANIVTLSRMLKSALLMNISSEDENYIRKLPEINETNAVTVVDKLMPIMSKYTPLDINTNAGINMKKK